MSNYYMVLCKCGHVGRNKYKLASFSVKAESAKEAASFARDLPRVKHDHKDAIKSVVKISSEDYHRQRKINRLDPYLNCKTKKEQNLLGQLSEIYDDEYNIVCRYPKHEQIKKTLYLNKRKVKIFSCYKNYLEIIGE